MNPTARPRLSRTHWYWIFQLLGWCAIIIFNMFANGYQLHKPGFFAICIWSGVSGLILSDIGHRAFKALHWDRRPATWRIVASAAFILGPLQTVSNIAVNYYLFQKNGDMAWLHLLITFWSGIMVAWAVCYLAILSLRRNTKLEAEALRLEVLAKDAELRALQAQVNPHFFFNSLNSVRALIYESPDAAAQMIDQLATLMRHTLQSSYSETVPLRVELEAVQAYLAIEKIRFEDRLQVSFEIAPGMEGVHVPPMALQTLVENAVKYGVEASSIGTEIRIGARREGGHAVIEIANAGSIRSISQSTGVGLGNARRRLAHAKGPSASLDLTERDGWVRATLQFPVAA